MHSLIHMIECACFSSSLSPPQLLSLDIHISPFPAVQLRVSVRVSSVKCCLINSLSDLVTENLFLSTTRPFTRRLTIENSRQHFHPSVRLQRAPVFDSGCAGRTFQLYLTPGKWESSEEKKSNAHVELICAVEIRGNDFDSFRERPLFINNNNNRRSEWDALQPGVEFFRVAAAARIQMAQHK
jgi:hypothetical protein